MLLHLISGIPSGNKPCRWWIHSWSERSWLEHLPVLWKLIVFNSRDARNNVSTCRLGLESNDYLRPSFLIDRRGLLQFLRLHVKLCNQSLVPFVWAELLADDFFNNCDERFAREIFNRGLSTEMINLFSQTRLSFASCAPVRNYGTRVHLKCHK